MLCEGQFCVGLGEFVFVCVGLFVVDLVERVFAVCGTVFCGFEE